MWDWLCRATAIGIALSGDTTLAHGCDRFLIRSQAERQPGEQVFQYRGPDFSAALQAGSIRYESVSESIPRQERHDIEAEGPVPQMIRALMGPVLGTRPRNSIDHPGHEYLELSSEGGLVILRLGFYEATRVDGEDMVTKSSEGVPVIVDDGSWEGFLGGAPLAFHLSQAGVHAYEHVVRGAIDGALAQIERRFENNFASFAEGHLVQRREIERLEVEGVPQFTLQRDTLVVRTPRVRMQGVVEFQIL